MMIIDIMLIILLHWNTGFLMQISRNTEIKNNQSMEQIQKDQVLDFAKSIKWLGQATVKIVYQGQTIYIDPYQIKNPDKADLIMITHDHMDHLSLGDIREIADNKTRFIVAKACEDKLRKEGYTNIQAVLPGETVRIKDLVIKAVPAYNVVKQMHKKSSKYLGFLIEFGDISVYHTGDTERIPEMKQIECDIIILPLGQTYTMNSVEEAVNAVLDTKAKIAIPIHYGMYEGTKEDAVKFGEMLKKRNIEVIWGN
jgi:L-ascorbate metabolism protein UlaG (beta-lactamase superfamily)